MNEQEYAQPSGPDTRVEREQQPFYYEFVWRAVGLTDSAELSLHPALVGLMVGTVEHGPYSITHSSIQQNPRPFAAHVTYTAQRQGCNRPCLGEPRSMHLSSLLGTRTSRDHAERTGRYRADSTR